MVESREKPRGREVAGRASPLPAVNTRAVEVKLEAGDTGSIRGFCPVCHRFFDLDEPRCPGDETELIVVDASSGERVGEVLEDRLTLLDLVGSGGMGVVYRAYQHSMEREVAVKLLHRSYSDDPIQVRRFLREAKGASQLAHPNVITLFDFGKSSEGELYLVMELLKGRSLAEIIRSEGAIGFERAVALIAQVCDALQAAHEMKVIHRDIKPDNIFVVGGAGLMGEFVKVIDFGLAKMALATPVSTTSQRGNVNGTPAYMSPEQIMGREVDGRSDVYALGVVLYEMISGRLPFVTRQAARMLVAHITERPAPLSEVFPDEQRPRELDDVVQAALAKQPKERPESALELRCQLQRALAALEKNLPSLPVRGAAPAPSCVAHDSSPSLAPHSSLAQTSAAAARSDSSPTLLGKRSPGSVIFDAEVEMGRSVPPVAHHLPTAPASFVGRRQELTALEGLLADGHRLITINGPAGIGKTRLTLQLASSFVDRRSQLSWRGIWFCDLADVHTTEDICRAVAGGMNLSLPRGQSIDSTIKRLGSAIAERGKVLLILDNFEQLIDFASVTVGAWHELAPEACFLVTTRTVLHLSDERVFELEPLSLSKESSGEVGEACELFIERAQSARPDWRPTEPDREAIRAIVQRLDGLPWAIELAAARMSILSSSKLLQRLTERFELGQALLILQEHGDRFEGLFLGALAAVSQEAGALNEARMQYEQAIEALRKVGARRHEGMILGYLGGLEWEQGRYDEARRRLEQSIAIAQEVGDRRNAAIFNAVLGGLDATEERLHQAENHFQKAELLLRELDSGAHWTVVELHRGHLDLALNRRASLAGPLEEAAGCGRSIQQRLEAANSPHSRDKAPTQRSDDVRFALRMLRRALEN